MGPVASVAWPGVGIHSSCCTVSWNGDGDRNGVRMGWGWNGDGDGIRMGGDGDGNEDEMGMG